MAPALQQPAGLVAPGAEQMELMVVLLVTVAVVVELPLLLAEAAGAAAITQDQQEHHLPEELGLMVAQAPVLTAAVRLVAWRLVQMVASQTLILPAQAAVVELQVGMVVEAVAPPQARMVTLVVAVVVAQAILLPGQRAPQILRAQA